MKYVYGMDIQKYLKEVAPEYIAVAYIGATWACHIDPNLIKEIIVSPTLGTDAKAVAVLANRIKGKWDSIHLLDSLHAKIYLGKSSALVGSFNLSQNGLSGEHKHEAGFLVTEGEQLREIKAHFEMLKKLAQASYPENIQKIAQLEKIPPLLNHAVAEGVFPNPPSGTSIKDYHPLGSEDFYICWEPAQSVKGVKLDHKALINSLPDLAEDTLEDQVLHWTNFRPEDSVKRGRWILLWQRLEKGGKPSANFRPYWFYIHDVVENAVKGTPYSTAAIQRKPASRITPSTEPFVLDKKTIQAMRSALSSGDFAKLIDYSTPNIEWSLNDSFQQFIPFIDAIKRYTVDE
jgi:hypothetical protein